MADEELTSPRPWSWLPRHHRSNIAGTCSNNNDALNWDQSVPLGQNENDSMMTFMLQADSEGKSAIEIAESLKADFDVDISPSKVQSDVQSWKITRSAWQKHWTTLFRAVDELVQSGARCRLSSEGRVLSEEEVKDLRECFYDPSLAARDYNSGREAGLDGGWDVVDIEDANVTELPKVDIEVLETTGPWTSIKTFSDSISSAKRQPTSSASGSSERLTHLDLSFDQFEKTVLRTGLSAHNPLLHSHEGIHQVYRDMQRLVLEIQKATMSPRSMDPAALFLYLRSFMPRQAQHNSHSPLIDAVFDHAQPQSTSSKRRSPEKTPIPPLSAFEWSHNILIDKNDMSATTVLRTLLSSVANNFAGLDDIPTSTVLTHLRQTPSALSLLRSILKLPGHIPRALADNLLKAAVEAKDVEAATLLLALRDRDTATDINEVRAKSQSAKHSSPAYGGGEGKKSMPKTLLEQAAGNRDVKMVRLLLEHGADPNSTIPGDWSTYSTYNRGPLAAVVGGDPRMMAGLYIKLEQKDEETKENGIICAKMLLQAREKVEPTIVGNAVANGETGLAVLLGLNVDPKQHRTMISHATLVKLIRYCEKEEEAVEMIKRWDWMCRETKCGKCAKRYGKGGLTWVLIEACRREFLELFELFTKDGTEGGPKDKDSSFKDIYGPHINWALVLCASMRTRNPVFIDGVISMSPDIKGCKPDTIDQHADDFECDTNADRLSTPLSEAIENDLPDYIAICESHGALEILKTDKKHRKYAFEAAAAAGNVDYIHKIFTVAPISGEIPSTMDLHIGEHGELGATNPSDVTDAMSIAILNGHDDAFYALFNAGGDIENPASGSPRTPDPIFSALLTRNLPIMQTLFSAGAGTPEMINRYYHSFRQPLKTPVREKLDGGRTGYVGCEFSSSHAHLERETSDLLEEAILWGRRDVLLGLKTLRPPQCLSWPNRAVLQYLSENHGMIDFLVQERMIDGDSLEKIMAYAFGKQDEALLSKMFQLGACQGAGFVKALNAGLKCPKLLRKALDEHATLFPDHTCNFRNLSPSRRDTADPNRERNEPGGEVSKLFLGAETLIEALGMKDSNDLETKGRAHFAARAEGIPHGRRLGREAAWVLLESELVDVRGTRYSRTPMTVALGVHEEIVKKRFGQGGEKSLNTADGDEIRAEHVESGDADEDGLEDEVAASRAVISALLAHGCHPDDPSCGIRSNAATTFLMSIATKDIHLVQKMIRHGATINYPKTPKDTLTGTHFRPEQSPYSAVIQQSVDDKRHFLSGLTRTPLQMAVEVNSAAIVEVLLNPKDPRIPRADPNAPAAHRNGATALQLAAWQGNCGIAATLLAHGADINAPACKLYGKSALEGAAECGRLEMIDFLRANGYRFGKQDCERSLKKAEEAGEGACAGRIREILGEIVAE